MTQESFPLYEYNNQCIANAGTRGAIERRMELLLESMLLSLEGSAKTLHKSKIFGLPLSCLAMGRKQGEESHPNVVDILRSETVV